jgi:RNA polymerase sigma-70 factor, ECF subfamily
MSVSVAAAQEPSASSFRELPAAVVTRAKDGNHEAFAAIVQHYDPGLRALAYRLLGDRDRMDDALQEAYLRAYRALPRFRGRSKLGTWLYRIVYNTCLDELRRARAVPADPFEDMGARPERRLGVAEAVEARDTLTQALAGLDPRERAAVLLVDAFGFGYEDAADVLDVPVGTVASRLNRARGDLRRSLEARPEREAQDA